MPMYYGDYEVRPVCKTMNERIEALHPPAEDANRIESLHPDCHGALPINDNDCVVIVKDKIVKLSDIEIVKACRRWDAHRELWEAKDA